MPLIGAGAAFLYWTRPRRSRDADPATTLLIMSINEGKKPVPLRLQKAAVSWAMRDTPSAQAVLVARQEAAEQSWTEALRDAGFESRIADVQVASGLTRLEVYGKESSGFLLQEAFSIEKKRKANKGTGAVVVLEHHDNVLCLGGFHLDGNAPQGREVPVLDAMARSAEGATEKGKHIHATVFVGDMNFPLSAESSSSEVAPGKKVAAIASALASQVAEVRDMDKTSAIVPLQSETRRRLQAMLGCPSGRRALLQAFDSCPESFACSRLPEGADKSQVAAAPSELRLCGMEPGSFPTYRPTNRKGRCLDALAPAVAAQSREVDHPGIWPLWPDLELPSECIKHCFFADKKAGVLKKRGDMVRLNLGWMDRLFYGLLPGEPIDLDVRPGTPALLWDPGEMGMLDHALVSWHITLRRRDA